MPAICIVLVEDALIHTLVTEARHRESRPYERFFDHFHLGGRDGVVVPPHIFDAASVRDDVVECIWKVLDVHSPRTRDACGKGHVPVRSINRSNVFVH